MFFWCGSSFWSVLSLLMDQGLVTANGSFGDCQWKLLDQGLVGGGDVLDYIFLASRLWYVGLHAKLFRHVFIIAYGPTFDDALCVFNTTTETGPSSTPSEIDAPNSWDIYISQDHTSVGLAGGSNFWFETDYERGRIRGSFAKEDGSFNQGSVDPSKCQNGTEHVFKPPTYSRSDFVIIKKKVIQKANENKTRQPLRLSLKNGLGFVKIESRSKTHLPRRTNSSKPGSKTPQPSLNSSRPNYENYYPMNWNNS
ncbi:hypothetical protein Tco_0452939 [Tanacetum coccineum]